MYLVFVSAFGLFILTPIRVFRPFKSGLLQLKGHYHHHPRLRTGLKAPRRARLLGEIWFLQFFDQRPKQGSPAKRMSFRFSWPGCCQKRSEERVLVFFFFFFFLYALSLLNMSAACCLLWDLFHCDNKNL